MHCTLLCLLQLDKLPLIQMKGMKVSDMDWDSCERATASSSSPCSDGCALPASLCPCDSSPGFTVIGHALTWISHTYKGQHLVSAGKKSKLAEMMAFMRKPARMVKLELVFASIYAWRGGWHHAKLGWHVEGKPQYGAWVLVHGRHRYRIEQMLCWGNVDSVKKLGVTLWHIYANKYTSNL